MKYDPTPRIYEGALGGALFALIILTQLDGHMIRVEHSSVIILKEAHTGATQQCKHGHGSAISVAGRGLCVKETPDEICAKIEKFGGKCEEAGQ
jgi:hypothetical protein